MVLRMRTDIKDRKIDIPTLHRFAQALSYPQLYLLDSGDGIKLEWKFRVIQRRRKDSKFFLSFLN